MILKNTPRGDVEVVAFRGRTYMIWLDIAANGTACPAVALYPPMPKYFVLPKSLVDIILKHSTLKIGWDRAWERVKTKVEEVVPAPLLWTPELR